AVSARDSEHAPAGFVQTLLSTMWCDVLHRDHVGLDATFFDSGGDSLSAARLHARICRAFAVDMPLRWLFEPITCAQLGERLAALRREHPEAVRPGLTRAPSTSTLPLSFAQERLWFIDQLQPGNPVYNIPFALRIEGALDRRVLHRVLTGIV